MMINKGIIEIRPQSYDSSYLQCVLSNFTDESEIPIRVQTIVDNYKPLKIKEAPVKLKIILKDDIPIAQRPRRIALQEEETVKQQIENWLANGIIRPSYSEYASPLVLVKKKDGSTRICVDYRKINQKMVEDEYPLPVINDHIDKLCTARVFSTLDLKNGFFHLPVEEDEGPKAIKEVLKDNEYEDYVLENDVIYKGEDKKLVVPELMDLEIIIRAHGIGHFVKKKIKDIIEQDYYISKLDNRSIQTSPFDLLTGTKMKLREDMKILELLEEQNRREFMDKRDELRKEAKVQILKIQEENKRSFNSKRKEGQKYKIGDIVAIQRTQFGNALKLKQKFFGPYKVVKDLGKDRYEVRKLDNSKEGPKHTTTGVDYMKRWP